MLKTIFTGCGVALLSVATALPVYAQATPSGQTSTLILSDGERISGDLVELDARGYTLRINGQDRVFAASRVAAIEYVAPSFPAAVRARIDGGESLVVMRSGQVIPGRLVDIGGNQPKRLSIDTPSGQRVLLSDTVAEIYLFPVKGTATAQAQPAAPAHMRFQVMDRNGDGAITRDEWNGSARSFTVHDWNGDGRLSGDEVRVGAQQSASVDEADHNPTWAERYMSWTDASFTSLDHNRDSRITANEWHYARETFLRADRNRDGALDRAEFLGADVDDDRGDQFEDLDVNRNGRIERVEWHASNAAFVWLDQNGDGWLSRLEVTGADTATPAATDQFASLDYDRNGTIARDEWHWSLGSFSQRDLNKDGVLSRREFATGVDTENGAAGPQVVRVNAQQEWTETGLVVRAGDVLTFSAQGSVQMSPDANDVATPAGARSGRRAPGAPVSALAGALIAKIGDGAPFLVGDRRSITAPIAGRLYLGVNDDHMPDNAGEFQVTVAIQGRRF